MSTVWGLYCTKKTKSGWTSRCIWWRKVICHLQEEQLWRWRPSLSLTAVQLWTVTRIEAPEYRRRVWMFLSEVIPDHLVGNTLCHWGNTKQFASWRKRSLVKYGLCSIWLDLINRQWFPCIVLVCALKPVPHLVSNGNVHLFEVYQKHHCSRSNRFSRMNQMSLQ